MRVRADAKFHLHRMDMLAADLGIDNSYDPLDAQADRVGEENPIRWVRWTERRVREAKRLRRIGWATR